MHRATPILALLRLACFGQTAGFEAASIKPAAPVEGHQQYHMTVTADPGRITFGNASLTDLIRTAYGVSAFQVKGPEWMATQKFDVMVKLPDGSSREQVPEMLRALLTARFRLAAHHAQEVLPGVAMVVAKGGPKLTAAAAEGERSGWSRSFTADGTMHVEAKAMSMRALADLVASFLAYPVVDMTGVSGEYDLGLDFSPEDLVKGSNAAGVIDRESQNDQTGSSVPASLKRVGLRLESRKLPLEVIVVDRLEKVPSEN